MQKVSVEVFEEPGRTEGGHAVVRLLGLSSLPDDLSFRIKPVDSAHFGDLQRGGDQRHAWPDREYRPIATRMTDKGAELVIGPEIVENPLFLPGTLTVIEISKCGVRGEFLWPRIAPLVRPKRRHLRLAKPQREAPAPVPPVLAFEEAMDASAGTMPRIAVVGTPTLALDQAVDAATVAPVAAGAPAKATEPETSKTPTPPTAAVVAEPFDANQDPFAELRNASASAAAADVVWNAGASPRKFGILHLGVAMLAGGLAASLLAALASSRPAAHRTTSTIASSAHVPGGVGTPGGETAGAFADLLAVGPRSPKGRDVSQSNANTLLEAADVHLHGPPDARDEQEAVYLLRRYLATTLSEQRTLWAITQLGSNYAEPATAVPPDYARARQLWRIAGTLGDPVAMCFLAALHEHGLGVTADRAEALQWYTRAKAAGGCAQVDDAIARMSK